MKKIVRIDSPDTAMALFGVGDAHARRIEEMTGVHLINNGVIGEIEIIGESEAAVTVAMRALEYLSRMIGTGDRIEDQTVDYVIRAFSDGNGAELGELTTDAICITTRGKPIRPKTVGQKRYAEAIRKNTVVFGIGPAGTGKTFLAVAMAVDALRRKEINRIVLTRPAVEAGERLGFLPGDLQSKIDPYLRPLYDALFEMLGPENYQRHLEKNTIEIAPLAYMRGRTLDDSFIILDEAQNTTPEQMKMFLTRLGNHSKAVVTGDPTQTDLAFGNRSGLTVATRILEGIDDIAIHRFTDKDVVRHKLVQEIILAYERFERESRKPQAKQKKKEEGGK